MNLVRDLLENAANEAFQERTQLQAWKTQDFRNQGPGHCSVFWILSWITNLPGSGFSRAAVPIQATCLTNPGLLRGSSRGSRCDIHDLSRNVDAEFR